MWCGIERETLKLFFHYFFECKAGLTSQSQLRFALIVKARKMAQTVLIGHNLNAIIVNAIPPFKFCTKKDLSPIF